jgi:hypothetical protein
MCRFDETRDPLVVEWLQDYGLAKALAEMVIEYDPCPKKQTKEFLSDEGLECAFTSSCACTTEKRDRRFIFKKDDTRFEFNGETRPVRMTYHDESLELDKGSQIEYKYFGDIVSFSYRCWTPCYKVGTDETGWFYYSTSETIDLYDVMKVIADTKP